MPPLITEERQEEQSQPQAMEEPQSMDHSHITEQKINEQPQSVEEVLEEQPMRRTDSSPELVSESEEDVIDLTQD